MIGYYKKAFEKEKARHREVKDRFLRRSFVIGLLAFCMVNSLAIKYVSAHEVSPQGEKVVISVDIWDKGSQNTIWGIIRDALKTYTGKEPTDAEIVNVINQTSESLKPIFGTRDLNHIDAGEYTAKVVELFRDLNIQISVPKTISIPVPSEKKPINTIAQEIAGQKKRDKDTNIQETIIQKKGDKDTNVQETIIQKKRDKDT
ncbi:hypothetical protein KKA14_10495, partial [bacterium]|nr:hypothetical protein [bacterium]